MRLQQRIAQAVRYAEEAREHFGKHIVVTHGKPLFERSRLVFLARFGQAPETALLDETKLIVVVEDRASAVRDAEVLQQEIARKDVAEGEFLDGLAVVDHRGARRFERTLARVEIQRPQAPLDVAMLDQEIVAVDRDGFRALSRAALRAASASNWRSGKRR